MIDIPEVLDTLHSYRKRGRVTAQDHRIPDDSTCTLLIINEADGAWTIHGLGAIRVWLTKDVTVTLVESILRSAR